jgi:hypothetical protein
MLQELEQSATERQQLDARLTAIRQHAASLEEDSARLAAELQAAREETAAAERVRCGKIDHCYLCSS